MTWLGIILAALAGGLLCGIGGYQLGHLFGVSDGKQAEKINRAEQDLRLAEARRERARSGPWVTTLAPPRGVLTGPLDKLPEQRIMDDPRLMEAMAREHASYQLHSTIDPDSEFTSLAAMSPGPAGLPHFMPAPVTLPDTAA